MSPADSGDEAPSSERRPPLFKQLGVRVPFIVVSPFSKPHYVSHHIYTHTSWLRLVQARFDLPALSARDANDTPPYDLFDFAAKAFLKPPALPSAPFDLAAAKTCKEMKFHLP